VAPKPQPEPEAPKVERSAPIKVVSPKHDPKGLLRWPTKATTHDIIVDPVVEKRLAAFMQRHVSPTREGMSAALLTGPAGTGKTQMVDYIAAQHGIGVYDANAMGYVDFTDWTGRTGIDKDGTRFIWNPLMDVIRADGPYGDMTLIVKVDEFNRTPSTTGGNFWLPIIEEGRIPVPEAGEIVDINRNVIFVFTVNEGAGYGGTVDIDTAIRDRMDTNCRIAYLDTKAETDLILDRWGKHTGITREQARQVVTAAQQVRSMAAQREVRSGVSTRNILKAVEQMQYGLTLNEAAHAIWTDAYPDEAQRERVSTAINASIPA
jgi:MoxR-like ATPase